MLSRIPRRRPFLCLAPALTVALGTFGICAAQEAATRNGPNEKIVRLLRERLDVVTQLHGAFIVRYENGTVQLEDVLDVQTMMLDARLPFCETKEDRVRIYEQIVASTEKILDVVKAKATAGLVHQTDILMAQARLLAMQIELEKVKARE